jgi:A nuclease of the HNH/ENDO VII superfamily with conserved WHH
MTTCTALPCAPTLAPQPPATSAGPTSQSAVCALQAAPGCLTPHAHAAPSRHEVLKDLGKMTVSITGIVDPTPISDGIGTVWALIDGEWLDAGISALGVVPYIGDLAKAGKLGQFARTIEKAVDLAQVDAEFARAARPLLQKIKEGIDTLPLDKLPRAAREPLQRMHTKLDEFFRAGAVATKPVRLEASMLDGAGLFLGKANAGPNAPLYRHWLDTGRRIEVNPDASITYINRQGLGVRYAGGAPDFRPFMNHPSGVRQTRIEMTGNHPIDFRRANEAAGHPEWGSRSPPGYSWHHHEDGRTMQLVRSDVHTEFSHRGGAALARAR